MQLLLLLLFMYSHYTEDWVLESNGMDAFLPVRNGRMYIHTAKESFNSILYTWPFFSRISCRQTDRQKEIKIKTDSLSLRNSLYIINHSHTLWLTSQIVLRATWLVIHCSFSQLLQLVWLQLMYFHQLWCLLLLVHPILGLFVLLDISQTTQCTIKNHRNDVFNCLKIAKYQKSLF